MNLKSIARSLRRAQPLSLSHPLALAAFGTLGLGALALAFALGLQYGQRSALAGPAAAAVAAERSDLAGLRAQVQGRLDAMAIRVGQLNAHLIRLDALGKRLTEMADISSREFDFDAPPAVGGPEDEESASGRATAPDLEALLDAAEQRLDTRDAQLVALENVILSRRLDEAIRPEGRPVLEGYISSHFGERQDPFTGHGAVHRGVDFAGVPGSNVVAVAAGVVTRAGPDRGYGNLVELNHGNGYVTRYAHNRRLLVREGDLVTRGQAVATLGSSGRSTGPHVHFEVLRNGRHVNPARFVGR